MSRKQASKRTGRRKAVTVLGAAGALSLAGSASAAIVGPAEDITEKDTASRHVITLSEEEVFDVSLATFYVFDKEDARAHSPGVQLAAKGVATAVAGTAAAAADTAALEGAAAADTAAEAARLRYEGCGGGGGRGSARRRELCLRLDLSRSAS